MRKVLFVFCVAIFAVSLAACGGGGSGSSSGIVPAGQPNPQSIPAGSGGGTISFSVSATAPLPAPATGQPAAQAPAAKARVASGRVKPKYVSPAITEGELAIDGTNYGPISCVANQSGTETNCYANWVATVGTHSFSVEIDDGSNVLAVGTETGVNVVAGPQTLPALTLNGVSASAVINVINEQAGSGQGSYAVGDADLFTIIQPGGYDNGAVYATASDATVANVMSANNTPPLSPTTYFTFSYNCLTAGNFNLEIVDVGEPATPTFTGTYPPGVTYPNIQPLYRSATITCTINGSGSLPIN